MIQGAIKFYYPLEGTIEFNCAFRVSHFIILNIWQQRICHLLSLTQTTTFSLLFISCRASASVRFQSISIHEIPVFFCWDLFSFVGHLQYEIQKIFIQDGSSKCHLSLFAILQTTDTFFSSYFLIQGLSDLQVFFEKKISSFTIYSQPNVMCVSSVHILG